MSDVLTESLNELYHNILSSFERFGNPPTIDFSNGLESDINELGRLIQAHLDVQEQNRPSMFDDLNENVSVDQANFDSFDLSDEADNSEVENNVNMTEQRSEEFALQEIVNQNGNYEIEVTRTVTNTLKRTIISTENQARHGNMRRRHFSLDDRRNYLLSGKRGDALEELSPSTNTEKVDKAMKVRHSSLRKTIAMRMKSPTIEEEDQEDDQQTENWNINPDMYAKNDLWRSLCVLCNKNERSLVLHYVRQHPASEVLIARLSPHMAKRVRDQIDLFKVDNLKIAGICYFCEEMKSMTKSNWAVHYLTHTGEEIFHCDICGKSAKTRNGHVDCPEEPQNIYEGNSSEGSLMAYMCIECNYLQVRHDRMVQHVAKQHQHDEADITNYYGKVTLVPDMSSIKSSLGMLDEPTKRYRCTICTKRSRNLEEFVKHFDDTHSDIDEYKCICGHLVVDEFISGNSISDHLKTHDAKDLYQCKICDEVYLEKAKIENHLFYDHGDCRLKYHHIHRETKKKTSITEIKLKTIYCNACKVELDGTFIGALEHLGIKHEAEKDDLSGISSMKITHLAAKATNTKTSYTGNNKMPINI